tara:strand:+ start:5333 stop:6499 length:1167 start_codon:yes stop_codon:yes gene_type:complete
MSTSKQTFKKLSLAYSTWDHKELKAIQEVIDSGNFTMGKKVDEFEKNFSKYLGRNYSVMVNSGSSANLLMIGALFVQGKLKKGDEVIVPAVSWSTTFLPLQQYGLKVKFIDIDLDTLNIDLEMLKKAITEKTKAVFIVNLLGNPIDKNKLYEIVNNSNIKIIEDNCESLGARFNGEKAGNFGEMSSHSFFFSHHISTMEGGMISTQDEEQYLILKSLRAHGWTRDLPQSSKFNDKSDDPFYNMFNFVMPGYNLRPLEMSGAIGIEQIKKLDGFIKTRRKNAEAFQEVMSDKENILLQKDTDESSWFGFSLINKDNSISPTKFRKKISDLGFEIRPIVAGNFTRNKVINYFDYEIFGDLKNADFLHDNGLFIGNNSVDISQDLQRLSNL